MHGNHTDSSASCNESSSYYEGSFYSSGNNDDDGDEELCIDSRLLIHLSQKYLENTLGKEPKAMTLCDSRGSCEKSGHREMKMRTCCLSHASVVCVSGEKEEEGRRCVRSVINVNSLRVSGGGMILLFGRRWPGVKKKRIVG